jgi:hypothetical protein
VSSIEPDDSGGEIDGRKEVLPAFVVPCSNGSELLEFGKEVLDEVAGFVEIGVIGAEGPSVRKSTLRNRISPGEAAQVYGLDNAAGKIAVLLRAIIAAN